MSWMDKAFAATSVLTVQQMIHFIEPARLPVSFAPKQSKPLKNTFVIKTESRAYMPCFCSSRNKCPYPWQAIYLWYHFLASTEHRPTWLILLFQYWVQINGKLSSGTGNSIYAGGSITIFITVVSIILLFIYSAFITRRRQLGKVE